MIFDFDSVVSFFVLKGDCEKKVELLVVSAFAFIKVLLIVFFLVIMCIVSDRELHFDLF